MESDAKKLAYWREHHHRWASSGLSQRRYCEKEKLAFSTFDSWRIRVREADATAAMRSEQKRLTLVPAQIAVVPDGSGEIVLRSPAGWQVRLPGAVGLAWLLQLLSGLP